MSADSRTVSKTVVYKGDGSSFDLHLEANEIRWYQI
ncbi:1,3-beta-galactosyl-N-acetylhexosamine phosphorylase C-terminal domain-containing protein [Blautia sp. HCP28S3_G10]